jgi:hypothetical protein
MRGWAMVLYPHYACEKWTTVTYYWWRPQVSVIVGVEINLRRHIPPESGTDRGKETIMLALVFATL